MFWRKKIERQEEEEPRKKSLGLRIIKYISLFLLLVLGVIVAAGYWLTQTQSGLAWLQKTANGFLADARPLSFKITNLEGSIPFHFSFGIEASDERGRWLQAPLNTIAWNWRKLPGEIRFEKISAVDVDLQRFPVLPEEPAQSDTQDKPLTVEDVRNLIARIASFLSESHWWLPAVDLEAITVDALLPESLLPATGDDLQRLRAQATLVLKFIDNNLDTGLRAQVMNGFASQIYAPGVDLNSLVANLSFKGGPAPDGIRTMLQVGVEAEKPILDLKDFPADFLGDSLNLDLELEATANTVTPEIRIALKGPSLDAGRIELDGNGNWQSGSGWKEGRLDGPCALNLDFRLDQGAVPAGSPLAALQSPLALGLKLAGTLPEIDLALDIACADIEEKEYRIKDTKITLQAQKFIVPLDEQALEALEQENTLDLAANTTIQGEPIALATKIFLQALKATPGSEKNLGWRLGLRNLSLLALGASCSGNLAVILPEGGKPGVDGALKLKLSDWNAIGKLMPDNRFSGTVDLDIALASGLAQEFANPDKALAIARLPRISPQEQVANLNLKIPSLSMASGKKQIFEAGGVAAEIQLQDIFEDLGFRGRISASRIAAAGMKLSADIKGDGKLKGPLNLDLASTGSVNSKIAAQWSPGLVKLGSMEVTADLSALLGKKGRIVAGIRSAGPAQAEYGDKGIRVKGLDLRILPSGRLQANGGLAPDKLDLNINLENLDFKPWQALVPALPTGKASLSASLGGTPKRPNGKFRLGVNGLVVPNVPLAPVSMALSGAIREGREGSALAVQLELDPATVKALGGTVAQVSAAIPLVFGADGVPSPNMKGPLQAKVRWDGALGPLWNLVPIADMRLNGRLGMDLDARGTLEKPRISGFLAVNKARYENILLGVLLTDINLRVDLSDSGGAAASLGDLPGAMKLALSLSDGHGGTLTANGGGSLDGRKLDIAAKMNDLKPLRRRDIHIELSGHADVKGSAFAPDISGEIIVDKGEVLLNNLEMTGSVTTLDIAEPGKKMAPAPAKSSEDVGHLNVRVRMLPRFSVEGRGLASLWQANLLISGPLNDPQVTGNISSVRGNFDFLGKMFALTRGIVFFGGGSLSNPLLNIELTHDTPDLTAHIFVTGPVNKIRIRLTSDPAVPRDEILSRVLFGRSVNELSRMEALQLAGAVAQLAGFGGGSGPLGLAKKALGVDVLKIGTANTGADNQTDEDTGGGTTVEMGKYINDYIYMGVQQGFAADSTAFIIEIEITPRTHFELRSEKTNTWGGIKWKYNY